MTLRQRKTAYFVIEGLNSFATSFYYYYLFFFMQRQYGFGNRENLALAALNGFIYMFCAWFGGRFGQKHGYFKALRLGFATMAVVLLAGLGVTTAAGHVAILVAWTIGICFTWPNLEAVVSEKEDPLGLQRVIGIYNVVWAGTSAVAYFVGGMLLETLGLRSLFWIPLLVHLAQIGLLLWLEGRPSTPLALGGHQSTPVLRPVELNPRPIARARTFLRMSWVANPFAYVAINTVAAVIPGLATQLQLGPALAGVFCSIWFFSRLGTFVVLWLWTGWHYRSGWFLGAYTLLILSFGVILLVPNLAVIVVAQVAFGFAIGLIYYSSLYYSMNVGEAKGEHGGMHEAAIGAGIFAGPGLGATALYFFPGYPASGTWAVGVALCSGFVWLLSLVGRKR